MGTARHLTLFLLPLLLGACRSPSAGDAISPAVARALPSLGAPPPWLGEAGFVEVAGEGVVLHGVGTDQLDDLFAERCVDTTLAFERAANRARAEVARLVDLARASTSTASGGRTAIATLRGAEVRRAWFDGERTISVLVSLSAPAMTPRDVPAAVHQLAPDGGVTPRAALEAVVATNRARLEAAGACADPHLRADLSCCGPVETFCADPTRFDHASDGTCGCGEAAPCLFDFRCEVRSSGPRCVCRGPKCPCDDLSCRSGQVCGDGRCY